MAEAAFVGVGLVGLAALHRAATRDLAAIQVDAGLGIVELQRRALMQEAVLMQATDQVLGHQLLALARMTDSRALIYREGDIVRIERGFLGVVIALHVLGDGAVELSRLDELAVTLVDGRTETVGTADETHVVETDAVAQEARIAVGRHEHAGNVAEVQGLVAIWHARRDDRASGPLLTFEAI